MISIPIWLFVVLIVSNAIVLLLVVLLINLICYIHDMIETSVRMKRLEKKEGNKHV